MAKKADSFSDYKNIINNLKKGEYKPIYFLFGNEQYYIDKLSDYAEEHILSDAEKGFNQTIVYGKDVTGNQLVGICKRYPMMGNYQLVIVKEAQNLKELDYLSNYLDAPLASTILVLCWKNDKVDKRTKFYKSLAKQVVFESTALYDNQIPTWINQYCAEKKLKMSPKAAELMAEHIGNDLTIISNEIEKISINKKEGEIIDENDVEKHTGISKEFNVFELQKFLARKDFHRSHKILQYFASEGGKYAMPPVMASLYTFYSKIYAMHFEANKTPNAIQTAFGLNYYSTDDYMAALKNYPVSKVQSILKTLLDYDLKSKGVNDTGTHDGELYKEMLYKIIF
ncbi:MAG: DNA polymerase III subunit delta [Bacteroidetes bacterium]|nr:DNA polymerase III subunit delta [Bacteroidota bacterium]